MTEYMTTKSNSSSSSSPAPLAPTLEHSNPPHVDVQLVNNIYSFLPWEMYTEKGFQDYEWRSDNCAITRKLASQTIQITATTKDEESANINSNNNTTNRPVGTIHRVRLSLKNRDLMDIHVMKSDVDVVNGMDYKDFPKCFDLRFDPSKNWNGTGGRPYRGVICPPLDQKDCGSCWAFATASALTDRLRLFSAWLCVAPIEYTDMDGTKRTLRSQLSPYILAGCNWCGPTINPELAEVVMEQKLCNLKCDGGLLEFAYIYIHRNGSINIACNTSAYTYTCHSLDNIKSVTLDNVEDHHCGLFKFGSPYQVNIYENDKLRGSVSNLKRNELAIMNEIYTNGSATGVLGIAQEFYDFFDSNPDGIYDIDKNADTMAGHAVVIIGWGETRDNVRYWLVKNTWGWKWGDQGCFRIKRGVNLCGIESDVWASKPDASWTNYRIAQIMSDHEAFVEKHSKKETKT